MRLYLNSAINGQQVRMQKNKNWGSLKLTPQTLCVLFAAHTALPKSMLGCSPQWFSPLACRRRRVRASPPARCWSTRTSAKTAPAGTGPPNCAHRTEKKKIFKKSAVCFLFLFLNLEGAPTLPRNLIWCTGAALSVNCCLTRCWAAGMWRWERAGCWGAGGTGAWSSAMEQT